MIKKISSLVYREFRVSRKTDISRLLCLISYAVLLWVVSLTLQSVMSNMPVLPDQPDPSENINIINDMMIIMFGFFGIALGFGSDSALKSDADSGWLIYSFVLTESPAERTIAGYICTVLRYAAAALIWTVNTAVFCAVIGKPFPFELIPIFILLIDTSAAVKLVDCWNMLKVRKRGEFDKQSDKNGIMIMALFFAIIIIFMKVNGFDFGTLSDPDGKVVLPEIGADTLLWSLPLLAVLIAANACIRMYRMRYAYQVPIFAGARKDEKVAAYVKRGETETAREALPQNDGILSGFLYKNFCQNKLIFLVTAVLPIVMRLLTLAILLLSDDEKELDLFTDIGGHAIFCFLTFFASNTVIVSAFCGDDKKLFAYFTASVPNGIKQYMYCQYVTMFALTGIYLISDIMGGQICDTILYFVTGRISEPSIMINITFFFLMLFMISFSIPVIVRFGQQRGGMISVIAEILIFILVLGATAFFQELEKWAANILGKLMTGEADGAAAILSSLYPYVTAAVFILSYRVSCRLFMKGVDEYDG